MTASTLTDTNAVLCPVCNGQMWDNRKDKRNPKSPDWKCRDRSCKGVIWPAKPKPGDMPPYLRNAEAEDAAELAGKIGKPTMRDTYKSLTRWVIKDILPIYAAEFGECGPVVASAITATLFIQACQSGKVE